MACPKPTPYPQGAFGKVFQVRKRDTGEIFAMKVRGGAAALLTPGMP